MLWRQDGGKAILVALIIAAVVLLIRYLYHKFQ